MRGHIKKRTKGSWSIVIDIGKDPATGKRRQQWTSIKGTKKEAEKRLAEMLHEMDNGAFMKPHKTTLAEFIDRWLRDYVGPNLSPKTAEGYEHIMRKNIIPALGNMTLMQLKAEHLQRYYTEKTAGGLSGQTVRHHHTALHKALNTAVEWGVIARNVADAARPPKVVHREMQTWCEEDVTRFLEAAKATQYYALFYTALFTGMRRSEVLALRWKDIDLILSQVYVSRGLHCMKGGIIIYRPTKTAKGRRSIALSPSAYVVLREHREKCEADRKTLMEPLTDDTLVFSHGDGRPLLPNSVTHAWNRIARKTDLKHIRLHDARHTHASIMLKQEVHPKIVQERLGHANISVTLDTYSHVAPGLQRKAAERFDEAFANKYTSNANEAKENSR
jgi:integrase